MKGCDECIANIHLYLDGELRGQELPKFRRHIEQCAECREELNAQEELSALLQRTRPLYSAPENLRQRIGQSLKESNLSQEYTPFPRPRRDGNLLTLPVRLAGSHARIWKTIAAAVILIVVGSLLGVAISRHLRTDSYLDAAVAAHRSILDGSLPLEIRSESPEVVTKWFTGKVPFNFRLPVAAEASGQEVAYKLVGGRLASYKGKNTALIAYQMQQQKISLLIASTESAIATGGDEVHSGNLVFHYHKHSNFTIISWSTHGLTYALVSSLPGSGKQSCLVCHQNMVDGKEFAAYK